MEDPASQRQIDRGQGLVEQQDLWRRHERAGERHPPPLAPDSVATPRSSSSSTSSMAATVSSASF
jgi:hypothetical protein